MKILHLSAVNTWGGGENHLFNLCYELEKISDVQNNVFCPAKSVLRESLRETATTVHISPLANRMDPRYFLKLAMVCKKENFDLLHIHDTTALTLAVMADKVGDLPPMIFSKKTSFPIKDRKQTLFKYNYPKIKKILCVSEETRRVTAEKITDPQKLITIYHGVNPAKQRSNTDFNIRTKLNIKKDKILIGNIGNHIRAKNLETWIEVIDRIVNVQQRKDFFFVQMGSFTNRTRSLKEKVIRLGLQDHISFMGFVPEGYTLIPQFDMILVTSQSEGLPGVIYESFFHRTPVISTNVGGIPEVIEHGVNGLLAGMHDPQTLSEHILYLHKEPDLINKFRELSRKKVEEDYTSAVMAQKTIKEYKKILHGRS